VGHERKILTADLYYGSSKHCYTQCSATEEFWVEKSHVLQNEPNAVENG
jgi:hypothetical protein